LRSAPLKDARAKARKRPDHAGESSALEDSEIEKIIKKQGTSGSSSRPTASIAAPWWHFDFLEGLGGVEGYEAEQGSSSPACRPRRAA